MPESDGTYATQADFEAYAAPWTTTDADELRRQIKDAQRDLDDNRFGPLPRDETTGLKIVLAELEPEQLESLKRATCAQTLYRIEQGPEFFTRAQRDKIIRRTITIEGTLPIIGPQADRELQYSGLVRLTTSTGRGGRRNRFRPSELCDPEDCW